MKQIDLSNDYDKYLEYLSSRTWARIRDKVLERDRFECSLCGCPHNLEVHHLKYPDVLGTEPISDLMTLCRECHKKLEDYKKGHTVGKKMVRWYPPVTQLWVKFKTEEEARKVREEMPNYPGFGVHWLIFYAEDTNKSVTVDEYMSESDLEDAKKRLKKYDFREVYK